MFETNITYNRVTSDMDGPGKPVFDTPEKPADHYLFFHYCKDRFAGSLGADSGLTTLETNNPSFVTGATGLPTNLAIFRVEVRIPDTQLEKLVAQGTSPRYGFKSVPMEEYRAIAPVPENCLSWKQMSPVVY